METTWPRDLLDGSESIAEIGAGLEHAGGAVGGLARLFAAFVGSRLIGFGFGLGHTGIGGGGGGSGSRTIVGDWAVGDWAIVRSSGSNHLKTLYLTVSTL